MPTKAQNVFDWSNWWYPNMDRGLRMFKDSYLANNHYLNLEPSLYLDPKWPFSLKSTKKTVKLHFQCTELKKATNEKFPIPSHEPMISVLKLLNNIKLHQQQNRIYYKTPPKRLYSIYKRNFQTIFFHASLLIQYLSISMFCLLIQYEKILYSKGNWYQYIYTHTFVCICNVSLILLLVYIK